MVEVGGNLKSNNGLQRKKITKRVILKQNEQGWLRMEVIETDWK